MRRKKLTEPSPSTLKTNNPNSGSQAANDDNTIENVLVLQGGGSLGAFGCGVFKAIANNNIKVDIIAGTSIGGINAAIIAGSKDKEHPEEALERFWLELSESFVDLDKIIPPPSSSIPDFVEKMLAQSSTYFYDGIATALSADEKISISKTHHDEHDIKMKQFRSFYSSAIFGNEKMFRPRWLQETALSDPEFFTPQNWTYIYDHTPLVKTLENYINYDKLRPDGNPNSRLILTAVNILNAQPLTFDSSKVQITPKHILATSAYPLYNFRWVEVEQGIYSWDGSLLSNTPLREVIDASPVNDKRIFLVENYPKKVDLLPKNLPEVYHRARDIMFSDKTEHSVTMSKVITMYLKYIDELYDLIENHIDLSKVDQEQLKKIRRKYKKIKHERGAEIKDIIYITRDEPFPHMYENADFSPQTIKESIKMGEMKMLEVLNRRLD
ncbi:MAG: patatin-like phospholipase family protein [Nitrososphaeraceae archaeon]